MCCMDCRCRTLGEAEMCRHSFSVKTCKAVNHFSDIGMLRRGILKRIFMKFDWIYSDRVHSNEPPSSIRRGNFLTNRASGKYCTTVFCSWNV
jgi:hypothetical protein